MVAISNKSSARLGIVLALCSVPSVMSAIVLVPILPKLLRVFGSMPEANLLVPALLTIPSLCTAVLSPVVGYLGDRFGLKGPIVWSLIIFSIFGAVPTFIDDFETIAVTRVVLGIAQSFSVVLSIALIGQQFEGRDRERWLSFQALAASSSSLLLLPLSGFLAQTALEWHGPFLIFLSTIALAIALARSSIHAPERQVAIVEPDVSLLSSWMVRQCLISVIVAVLIFAMQFQFGLALSTVGLNEPGFIGLLSAVAVFGSIVGSLMFVSANRVLKYWLLPTELLIVGITFLFMKAAGSVTPLVILAFVNNIACGLMLPTLVTPIAAGLPNSVRGRGLGLWNSSLTFGQFLSGGIIGLILSQKNVDIFDAFTILGTFALLMAAAGFVLSFRSARNRAFDIGRKLERRAGPPATDADRR